LPWETLPGANAPDTIAPGITEPLKLLYHDKLVIRGGVAIQYNLIQSILYSPLSQITNLPKRALQSVHIQHPCPRTSHWIRKNSPQISQGKKGKKPSGKQQRRIPLPGWTEGIFSELQHI